MGYDVLARRRDVHRKAGGTSTRNSQEAARAADLILTLHASSQSLLDVVDELARAARPNQIVIETSTLPIPVKEAARARLAACGVTLLDCPLSGTGAQARNKDVVVCASGNRVAYRRCLPSSSLRARALLRQRVRAGSKMKFVANLLVAIHNVAAAEALVPRHEGGTDPRWC